MRNLAWRLWLPVLVLLLWQLSASAGLLNPLFFPAPSVLFRAAVGMTVSGELARNTGATLARAAVGFLIGSVLGLAAGLWMGGMPRVRQSLEPVISAFNATPKLSLFPLLLLFLGVGETAKISIIALGSLVVVAIHALDAVCSLHPAWVDMAINYGASRRALFGEVYLPACLPQIYTGLRLALANALVIAISCELVSPSAGLGSMIWLAWQTFSPERLYIAVLLTAMLGILLHEALHRLEKRVVPWKIPESALLVEERWARQDPNR